VTRGAEKFEYFHNTEVALGLKYGGKRFTAARGGPYLGKRNQRWPRNTSLVGCRF